MELNHLAKFLEVDKKIMEDLEEAIIKNLAQANFNGKTPARLRSVIYKHPKLKAMFYSYIIIRVLDHDYRHFLENMQGALNLIDFLDLQNYTTALNVQKSILVTSLASMLIGEDEEEETPQIIH